MWVQGGFAKDAADDVLEHHLWHIDGNRMLQYCRIWEVEKQMFCLMLSLNFHNAYSGSSSEPSQGSAFHVVCTTTFSSMLLSVEHIILQNQTANCLFRLRLFCHGL